MGFYSHHLFPRLYDFLVNRPEWNELRREQLAGVQSPVLEIGAGTGLNLPHYPDGISIIHTVEPNSVMNRRLQARAAPLNVAIAVHEGSAERLPFADAAFESVVSTLTLCSMKSPNLALAEILRVLRPGGRFFFLEHGLNPDPRIQVWQRRLNPLQRAIAAGCRLDLDVNALLPNPPFATVELRTFNFEPLPLPHRHLFLGSAHTSLQPTSSRFEVG